MSSCSVFGATDPELVASFGFDNEAAPLAATVGSDATVVSYSNADGVHPLDGLGGCSFVTDESIVAGLESGSKALTIPLGQAVRIAHGVATDATRPWCISMRVYLPENTETTAYNAIFDTFQNAEGDAAICVKRVSASSYQIGGGSGTTGFDYVPIAHNAWHIITLALEDGRIELYVDGELKIERTCTLDQLQSGRLSLKGRPYLFLSGDESGEDAPWHFDWVRIYNVARPKAIFAQPTVSHGLKAHYTFDTAERALEAAVGSPATVVDYANGSVTAVSGLGNCTFDTTLNALMIPKGQALRIEHGVSTSEPSPWCIVMHVYVPRDTSEKWNSLFSTSQGASVDGPVYIKQENGVYSLGGGPDDATNWGYYSFSADAWHTVAVSADEKAIRLYLDGALLNAKATSLNEMRRGELNLTDRPYLFLSGDWAAADAPLYFDEVKIYDVALPDELVTKTATWTAGGDVANPKDPANWSGGVVPDAMTEIVVSDGAVCQVPRTDGFSCGRVRIDDTLTLTGDTDWRGLGTAYIQGSGKIDLNGHRLSVSALRRDEDEDLVVTNGATETCGELQVDVPSGYTEGNLKVVLQGNVKLVKDGSGTFVQRKAGQTYEAGTQVAAGTFKCGVLPKDGLCGKAGSTNFVDQGAVFDVWGQTGFETYHFCLNGGTLTQTRNPAKDKQNWTIGDLSLTADSRIEYAISEKNVQQNITAKNRSTWNLGGRVLDMVFAGYDPEFMTMESDTVQNAPLVLKNGLLRVAGPGWFHDYGIDGREGGSLDLDNVLRLQAYWTTGKRSIVTDFTVHDTYKNVSSTFVVSDGTMNVWGLFTLLSESCFDVEMQAGSAIALGGRETALPAVFANGKKLSFADNATVTLKLGERRFSSLTKVIAWDEAPTNVATLKFSTDNNDEYRVRILADGVYVGPRQGLLLLFR